MPFKSKSQLRTCFTKELQAEAKGLKTGWDCKEWLSKTESPECLPNKKGFNHSGTKCRKLRVGEAVISPVYKGPNGGYYFYAGGVKIYVPKSNEALKAAKKKYGYK